jgi:small subunit ribosomal protein S36
MTGRPEPTEAVSQPLRARLRSIPRVIWIITATHIFLLFSYSVLFVPYRAPDEQGHVDMVLQVRHRFGYAEYDRAYYSEQVIRSLSLVHYERHSMNLLAEEAPPRSERPSFSELAPALSQTGRRILLATHPPLYYATLGGVSAVIASFFPGDDWAFDRVVGVLRILNILLLAGIPIITFAIVRRLGWSMPIGIAAAIVPLAIPQFTHIASTVNNDNMLTLLVSILMLLLVWIATGDLSRRRAVATGVVAGLALLTKGFAVALPVWVATAYATPALEGGVRRLAVRRTALALLVGLVVGGWWWLRNLAIFGAVQPGTDIDPRPPAPAGFLPDPGAWTNVYLLWTADRFWGSFGRVDVSIPRMAVLVATGLVLGAIVLAFIGGARPSGRLHLVLLLLPVLTTLGIVTFGAYAAYVRSGQPVGFHGRYLFPGLVGLAAVVALGLGHVLGRWRRTLPLLVTGGAVAMQAVALTTILPFYWGAPNVSLFDRIEAVVAWSTWPPVMVIVVFLATFVSAIWLIVEVVRTSLRPPRGLNGLTGTAEPELEREPTPM